VTFLDTHAVVFLFERRMAAFGSASRARMAQDALSCSPMVRVELALLREIGRIAVDGHDILDGLAVEVGLTIVSDGLDPIALRASTLSWTRDPFDRMIVAQASMWNAPLVTRDRLITAPYPFAVW
jgi:PIN domain nuclease of toxin-antitoxin system